MKDSVESLGDARDGFRDGEDSTAAKEAGEAKENSAAHGDDSDSAFVAAPTPNLALSFARTDASSRRRVAFSRPVSYTHLTLPTIYSV